MSFFGNSARPDRSDIKTGQENGSRERDRDNGRNAGRPETTFLGDQVSMKPGGDPSSMPSYNTDVRPGATPQTGPTPPERCTNVIAAGARWQGTLNVEDSVRVDGNFSGEIHAKGTVHVADGAQVDAKIRAAFVVIAGTCRGEIRCDQRVELLPRSRVNGEVITKMLTVQEGAVLDGRVQMTSGAGESNGDRPSTRASRNASVVDVESADSRREKAAVGPTVIAAVKDEEA